MSNEMILGEIKAAVDHQGKLLTDYTKKVDDFTTQTTKRFNEGSIEFVEVHNSIMTIQKEQRMTRKVGVVVAIVLFLMLSPLILSDPYKKAVVNVVPFMGRYLLTEQVTQRSNDDPFTLASKIDVQK